ncbi:MAG: arsenate reductase family protein [Micropepsaceae bacterium]
MGKILSGSRTQFDIAEQGALAGKVTIYHNPKCSKSRAVLEMLQASEREVIIAPYLYSGWSAALLLRLMRTAGVKPRDWLRAEEAWAVKLGLGDPAVADARIVAEMLVHPELVQRPIVESDKGVRLCRPAEKVLEIL